MFSKFFAFTRIFSSDPDPILVQSKARSPDQQAQAEFAAAVEEGMVTTRRQEQASVENGLGSQLEECTPTSQLKYRKNGNGSGQHGTSLRTANKKRRMNEDEELAKVNIEVRVPIRAKLQDKDGRDDYEVKFAQDLEQIAVHALAAQPASPTALPEDDFEVKGSQDSEGSMHGNVGGMGGFQEDKPLEELKKVALAAHHKLKESRKGNGDRQSPENSIQPVEATDEIMRNGTGINNSIKEARHTRFGSEEPPLETASSSKAVQTTNVEMDERSQPLIAVDEESEDDGPETVSAAIGLMQARTTAAEVEKATKRSEAANKEKRRELDARLKEQAKLAKKRRNRQLEDSPDTEKDGTDSQNNKNTGSSKSYVERILSREIPIPALLPDEILAAKPVIPLPTPPPELANGSRKRKFTQLYPKPAKDIKRGSVSLRLLEDNKSILPPRASNASKSLKERWLAGRRGPNGGVFSQRRKIGGGFVRKQGS